MKAYLQGLLSNTGVLGELLAYLWQERLWWLIPLVIVLIVCGVMLVFAAATGLGPLLYTLF